MSKLGSWLKAFRLRTLPLALSSILMGSFLAIPRGWFAWDIFTLSILTTVFLQILSNLANDYGDSIHGADSQDRKGPSRMVQSGAITAVQMRYAVILFAGLALASGILLLLVAFGTDWSGLIFFFLLGLLCIAAAIAYTVGRKPYGYAGLGDISVLIFFGLVGVMGSFYLYAKNISALEILPALSCGFFSVGVLNVNNIRDIESDKRAGKLSIPVRIGRRKAVIYHGCLLALGVVTAVVYAVATYRTAWQFLFLLTLPLFVLNWLAVAKRPSSELDPYLRQLAMSTLACVVLYGIGLAMTG